MPKRFPFILSVGLILAIAVLYWLGSYFQFHWRLSWYDYILHLLAGLLIGFIVGEFIYNNIIFSSRFLAIIISSAIISLSIGLIWEGFELRIGLTSLLDKMYARDT